MRHVGTIAGRELQSYFVSPMAYAVLAIFTLLSGFFFIAQIIGFDQMLAYYQQQPEVLAEINLNDWLIGGYFEVHWILLLFLVPGLTMNLFASEKQNQTEELLLTSPVTIWDIVLGKYLAVAAMVTLLTAVVAALVGITFWFGDPEPLQTLAGLLAVWLLGLAYAAFGTFTSSLTRSPLIAFFLAFFALLVLALVSMFAGIVPGGADEGLGQALEWISSQHHFSELTRGLIDTVSLAHFAILIAGALLLAKTSVESVRWR